MNWEEANKSWYSADTIAGVVSAGVTAGIDTGIKEKLKSMGNNGAALEKFYGSAISLGVSAAGKATEFGVHAAYSLAQGGSLKDAYDNMGGISVNILNLGTVADIIGTSIARNNATGQAGKWGVLSEKLSNAGILEVNFGSNGITSRFGNGGIDIGGNLYKLTKRLSDKASLQNYKANHSQSQGDAAYWAYVYGDWTQENTAARISSGRDTLEFVDTNGKPKGWEAQTTQNDKGGRFIQMLDTGEYLRNAIQLGHESYRDGITGSEEEQLAETIAAVLGHSAMAAKMMDYKNSLDASYTLKGLLYKEGYKDMLEALAKGYYDSTADYWRIVTDENGLIIDVKDDKDYENLNVYDKNGKLIRTVKKDSRSFVQQVINAAGSNQT